MPEDVGSLSLVTFCLEARSRKDAKGRQDAKNPSLIEA
jgi:hypothetical protein